MFLNGLHLALKFTAENECDGKLPFMDVLVHRVENGFVRSVFRKPLLGSILDGIPTCH